MQALTTRDGRRLAYRCAGKGPTLVCHGGGPGFSALYLADLGGLAEELELVLESDPPQSAARSATASRAAQAMARRERSTRRMLLRRRSRPIGRHGPRRWSAY